MTINDILPRSGMRARLPAPLPARITIVTHGACGETHWPAASAGPAAPIFGSIFLEKKKIQLRENSDVVFEFDRCNAKTRCFANFLDVR
jgi:hypothetical protein